MSNLETLQKMREDLKALHASSLSADEKDQQARKLRRQIRKLAAQLGQPSHEKTVKTSRVKTVKKSGSVINLDHVKMLNQKGEELEDGQARVQLTKAERRRQRRLVRQEKEVLGITPLVEEHQQPAVKCVPEITQYFEDHKLTVVADGEKRTGYGIVVSSWPVPDSPEDTEIIQARDNLGQSLIEKYQARLNRYPEWFFLLRHGSSVIVALGPVDELKPTKAKPVAD